VITAKSLLVDLLASDAQSLELGRWLVDRIGAEPDISEMMAFEHADRLQPELSSLMDARIARDQQRGVQPRFIWADVARTTLAQPSLLADEASHEREHLAGLVRPSIIEALSRFAGADFERVCAYLLNEYGMDPQLKGLLGQSGDGGIDFFGVLRPYQRPGPERLYTLGRRFLGQAKLRYQALVDSDVVESFGSRVASARINDVANFSVPNAFRDIGEPIVGLFITAGYLGPSARDAAVRHIVYAIEGDQVAEDLSRSSGVQAWLNETGTSIDGEKFHAYFQA
jgi:hypothetical protein